jgi:hypothetical protein
VGLLKGFRKKDEPPVEMLDVETLKSRIGEPPPKKPDPAPGGYVRADGRPSEERNWRKVARLTR